jgi:hypothetical protein
MGADGTRKEQSAAPIRTPRDPIGHRRSVADFRAPRSQSWRSALGRRGMAGTPFPMPVNENRAARIASAALRRQSLRRHERFPQRCASFGNERIDRKAVTSGVRLPVDRFAPLKTRHDRLCLRILPLLLRSLILPRRPGLSTCCPHRHSPLVTFRLFLRHSPPSHSSL